MDNTFDEDTFPTMYVISNKSMTRGSSAILDIDSIRNYFQTIEKDYHEFVVIMSSVHECILIPIEYSVDIEAINEMIREVNETTVKPEEQLGNHCYILNI